MENDVNLYSLRKRRIELIALKKEQESELSKTKKELYNNKKQSQDNCPHFCYVEVINTLLTQKPKNKYLGHCLCCDAELKGSIDEMDEVLYNKDGELYEPIDSSFEEAQTLFWLIYKDLLENEVIPNDKVFDYTKIIMLEKLTNQKALELKEKLSFQGQTEIEAYIKKYKK